MPGGRAEAVQVGVVDGRIGRRHRLVGTERRRHHHRESGVRGYGAVRSQVVAGIVGGAHRAYVERLHDAAHPQLVGRQQLVAAVVHGIGIGRGEQLVDPEGTPQLHVGPVVHRVAYRVRDHRGPGVELGAVVGGSGDELLGHAEGPHHPPLVVVAAEPDLRQVGELMVVRDLLRGQVAVIVEDRHLAGVVVSRDGARRGCRAGSPRPGIHWPWWRHSTGLVGGPTSSPVDGGLRAAVEQKLVRRYSAANRWSTPTGCRDCWPSILTAPC